MPERIESNMALLFTVVLALSTSKDVLLSRAVDDYSFSRVKRLLKEGASPNTVNLNGDPALFTTVLLAKENKNSLAQATLLLKSGANVDGRGEMGLTPLALAAEDGNFDLVKLLVRQGADVNARNDFSRALPFGVGFDGLTAQDKKALDKVIAGGGLKPYKNKGTGVLDSATSPAIRQYLVSHGAKSFNAEVDREVGEVVKLLKAEGAKW